jgi:hypothetical protein
MSGLAVAGPEQTNGRQLYRRAIRRDYSQNLVRRKARDHEESIVATIYEVVQAPSLKGESLASGAMPTVLQDDLSTGRRLHPYNCRKARVHGAARSRKTPLFKAFREEHSIR